MYLCSQWQHTEIDGYHSCGRNTGWKFPLIEKSKGFVLLTEWKDCAFRFSKSSLEFFRIHIWLTPFLAYAVSQYFWRPSLTAVRICVRIWERGLVEHLAESALYLCLYGFLLILGTQYSLGRSISSSGIQWQKYKSQQNHHLGTVGKTFTGGGGGRGGAWIDFTWPQPSPLVLLICYHEKVRCVYPLESPQ